MKKNRTNLVRHYGFKNNIYTKEILNNWKKALNVTNLIDDTQSMRKNHPNFIEYRHDQSMLSLILKKECSQIFKKMERWPSGLKRTLGKYVYPHRYRGFESHSLRHYYLQQVYKSIHLQ